MRAERTFHKFLKELQAYQSAHKLDEPTPKIEAKIDRDEQCPGHSGSKYKHCCLRKEPKSALPTDPRSGGSPTIERQPLR